MKFYCATINFICHLLLFIYLVFIKFVLKAAIIDFFVAESSKVKPTIGEPWNGKIRDKEKKKRLE